MPRKTQATAPDRARPVTFTHPEKVYFPSGFTKGDMIRYYLEVAPFILPHLAQRPVTLIRFPEGVKGTSFYEKNAPKHAPDWIETFPVPRHHHEGNIRYILINNAETLGWCANLGAIELHPFLHRAPAIDTPTQLAFDLDPGEGADIFTCLEVAQLLRKLLAGLGLEAWPKVSGSKGLQLYVPLNTPVTYAATSGFAKAVAELMTKQRPDLVVADMSKALRKKKVLIDWSQNSPTKTTVCVYAMRAKRDEPFISMPLTWAELGRAQRSRDRDALFFTPAEALRRVRRLGDLFAPVLTTRQRLPEAFQELAGAKVTRSAVRASLRRYNEKRDFAVTAEPRGEGAGANGASPAAAKAKRRSTSTPKPKPQSRSASRAERLRFVIQKHAARNLHYDFRLEMEGTLKSWAVPKGPPYEPGVKRAAFEVEDHPLDYMTFEGTIPKGQYGGGTVMVWDLGTYELLGGSHAKGDLKLRLHGKKLKGEWHIFRIRRDETKPLWLLVKSGEAVAALSARRDDMSVLTRRSMARIASDDDAQWDSDRGASVEPAKRTAARRVRRRAPARRAASSRRRG